MGCCCSKRRDDSAFVGEGHRLGTADEHHSKIIARNAADTTRFTDETPKPYTDAHLTEEERAMIREERLAAAEGRLTKQERKAMKKKKQQILIRHFVGQILKIVCDGQLVEGASHFDGMSGRNHALQSESRVLIIDVEPNVPWM